MESGRPLSEQSKFLELPVKNASKVKGGTATNNAFRLYVKERCDLNLDIPTGCTAMETLLMIARLSSIARQKQIKHNNVSIADHWSRIVLMNARETEKDVAAAAAHRANVRSSKNKRPFGCDERDDERASKKNSTCDRLWTAERSLRIAGEIDQLVAKGRSIVFDMTNLAAKHARDAAPAAMKLVRMLKDAVTPRTHPACVHMQPASAPALNPD